MLLVPGTGRLAGTGTRLQFVTLVCGGRNFKLSYIHTNILNTLSRYEYVYILRMALSQHFPFAPLVLHSAPV